jgi:hypothetical protein
MKKKPHNILYEFKHFTIHEHEFKQLPKDIQKAFLEHENLEFYPKKKPIIDPIAEIKRLIKLYLKEIEKNKGAESNVECIIINQIQEVLSKMMAYEVRKLGLEKLL